jgi:hypothetical protein
VIITRYHVAGTVYRAMQMDRLGLIAVEQRSRVCVYHTMHKVSRDQRNGSGLGAHIPVPTDEDPRLQNTGVAYLYVCFSDECCMKTGTQTLLQLRTNMTFYFNIVVHAPTS